MPTFEISGPDGATYQVEGATAEGAAEAFRNHVGGGAPKAPEKAPAQPGLFARVADAFTGASRTEFPDAPEFGPASVRAGNISMEDAKAGKAPAYDATAVNRSAITSDPAAALDILRKNIPGLESKQDKHGNLMLKAPGMADWAYLNKPGLSGRDLDEFGTQTLATLPFLGAAGQGATIPARIASGAGFMGSGELARQGLEKAAGSEQAPDDTKLAMATGLGGAFAPGVPSAIIGGAAATAKAVASPITNVVRGGVAPEAEAARRVATAYRDTVSETPAARNIQRMTGVDQLTPEALQSLAANQLQERAAGHGGPSLGAETRLMDITGERGRALARSASNVSPEARDTIAGVIRPRFESQGQRAGSFVEELAGGDLAGRSRDALEEMAYTARAPFYEAAFREGDQGIMTPALQRLAQAPAVRDAMNRTGDELLNKHAAGRLMTTAHGPDGPTLEYWDQVKRLLNDQFNRLSRQGRTSEAANIAGITDRLVAELDRNVGSYAQARGVSMGLFRANNALDAGENFAAAHIPNEAAHRALRDMSPQERELFRQGFSSRKLEQINATGDRRNLVSLLASSSAEREKWQTALGPIPARQLEAFLHSESLMDLSRTAVSGNSTTARQFMELGLAGGTGALISGFDPTNPAGWIAAVLTKYGAHRVGGAVDARVAQQVANMLVSRDPAVMRRGLSLAASNRPILEAMRRADEALSARIPRNVAIQENEGDSKPRPATFEHALALKRGTRFTDPHGVERVR